MRILRKLTIGVTRSAIWPAYFGLTAYAVRQAPCPKTLAQPAAAALVAFALAVLAANLVRRLFGPGGWAEDVLEMPPPVSRQVRRALVVLIAAHLVLLLPVWLLTQGMIAPGGRPASAPAVVRGLILGFETVVLCLAWWVLRRRSALVGWATQSPERLGVLARHQRKLALGAVAGIATVIVLDARGYSFSAHRLSTGAAGSLGVAAACWGFYRVLLRFIDEHAWKWVKVGQALAKRGENDAAVMPDDLAARLRRLSAYLTAGVGLLLAAQVWDVDLALFRFLSEQPLWSAGTLAGSPVHVTVGELTQSVVILTASAALWRHMSTLFAVAVFPRMPDDPGIRFAVVTLCRYAVLGLGLLCGLSSVHLGLEKIGVVLAALGVGLGFGLQEIVSNFVCGIILLLERPIRVGDIVTVGGMSGKVDRINIRATTITNGDNQSMIVPNRAFITGDLVNWTLKDKVIRVTVRVRVAHGTDPDRVSELLLAIARDDADVLRNPLPSALMEEIGDLGLAFALYAHVPEPSLAGRVKHRLYRQIQQRFADAGLAISVPSQTLIVAPAEPVAESAVSSTAGRYRIDAASRTPPEFRKTQRPSAEPVEESHRGVDE